MGFLDFFRRQPKARDAVQFDDVAITTTFVVEANHSIRWDALEAVAIVTTDAGPFLEDVFLVLGDGQTEFGIPQCAAGFEALLKRLSTLPGFNDDKVIEAMGCTSNKRFECWKRGA